MMRINISERDIITLSSIHSPKVWCIFLRTLACVIRNISPNTHAHTRKYKHLQDGQEFVGTKPSLPLHQTIGYRPTLFCVTYFVDIIYLHLQSTEYDNKAYHMLHCYTSLR